MYSRAATLLHALAHEAGRPQPTRRGAACGRRRRPAARAARGASARPARTARRAAPGPPAASAAPAAGSAAGRCGARALLVLQYLQPAVRRTSHL